MGGNRGQIKRMHQHLSAERLIHQLVAHGVNAFFIAPGSRSTPLVLAINERKDVKSYVHFDERALGFFALGYAKGAEKPVAIVTTSGTAVANLFPAVMEASLSRIPLLLLTADRPQELRDAGANQTVDQVKIFREYVRWQGDLLLTDSALDGAFWAAAIAHIVHLSKAPMPGPVHINCALREPFLMGSGAILPHTASVQWEEMQSTMGGDVFKRWSVELNRERQGIILGGPGAFDPEPILALSDALAWPIFADILSPLRRTQYRQCAHHFEAMIKCNPDMPCDVVLHVGDRMLSKEVLAWIQRKKPRAYFHVAPHPLRQDPEHLVTHRLCLQPDTFAAQWTAQCASPRTSINRSADADVRALLEQYFAAEPRLTEAHLAYALQGVRAPLFLGNSMPIRHADLWLCPSHNVYGNRGASGIDGTIATAIGIAAGLDRPVVACIGDQAALHDVNALALLKSSAVPLSLIVVDNGGGGIFSFLPISAQQDLFERFFGAPHEASFEALAEGFGIPYCAPKALDELLSLLPPLRQGPRLIHVQTRRDENVEEQRRIFAHLVATKTI